MCNNWTNYSIVMCDVSFCCRQSYRNMYQKRFGNEAWKSISTHYDNSVQIVSYAITHVMTSTTNIHIHIHINRETATTNKNIATLTMISIYLFFFFNIPTNNTYSYIARWFNALFYSILIPLPLPSYVHTKKNQSKLPTIHRLAIFTTLFHHNVSVQP